MTSKRSLRRLLRLALALGAILVASGLPGVAAALLDEACCADACGDEQPGTPCPPDCTGGCAKAPLPALAQASSFVAVADARGAEAGAAAARPVLPLVLHGVFHPPRA